MYYRLLKGLLNYKNLELTAILLNEGKLADEIRKLGIPVNIVDETRLNFFEIVRNVRKIITLASPDIIHSHRQKENILAYLSAKSDKKIQLVCTQHGMPEPLRVKLKIIKQIFLTNYNNFILSRHFKYIIAVSEDIQRTFVIRYGIPKEKTLAIYNGTDISNNHATNRKRNYFVIGSAGRLFPIKDYPFMVEIAREVIKHTDKVQFELAGEGPEMQRILCLIQKYHLENVFILRGFIDNMEPFYKGLDLYINTSFHEGFPMSILEAMAHGLPIISTNTGGLKEILNNGVQGYLVEERDPITFADKCLKIYRDKEIYLKMGTASREKVINEFSLGKMAEKYYNLYLNLLG